MKRILWFLSLIFVLCGLLFSDVPIMAVENDLSKIDTFTDVSKESEYYEAVEYLAEKGIVKGCGDSTFNPDSNIKLNHFAIMLIRAFGDIRYENRPLPICFNNGWISMNVVSQDPEEDISRGGVYETLFKIEKIDVFTEDGRKPVWEDYKKIVESFGLNLKNESLFEGITRGEVAKLFYYLLKNDVVSEMPDIIKDIEIVNTTTQNLGDYYSEFLRVPKEVLEIFKQEEWKIMMDDSAFLRYKEETGILATGLCDYSGKTLYFKAPASVVHEFGHFVDYLSDYNIGIDNLYELEGELFELNVLQYKLANSREYFAEYFKNYVNINYFNNVEKLEILKSLTPQTFEYMRNLEEKNWVLR